MATVGQNLLSIKTIHNWIDQSQLKTMASNSFILLAGATISQGLLLISLFLTARYLGVDAYGQYSATFTLLGQAAVLLNLGLDTWLLREGAKSTELIRDRASDALLVKLLLALPWLVIVVVAAPRLSPEVYLTPIVAVAGFGFVLQAVGMLAQAAFKSQLRNKITFLLQILGNIVLVLATLILIQRESTLAEFVWIRVLAFFCIAAAGLLFLFRIFAFSPHLPRVRSTIQHSFPFFLAEGLGYIYATADMTIVAIWLGKTAAGLYAPAITLLNAAFIIPNTLYTVVLPIISNAYHRDKQSARLPVYVLIIGLTVEGVIASGVTFLFAKPIIQILFGNEFLESAHLLAILSVILVLKSLSFAFGTVLTATDHQRDRVLIQSFVALGNVTLNLLIVNVYGLIGVAWVYVLTEFCLLLGYGWFAAKRSQGFTFRAT